MSLAVVFAGQGTQHPDMLPWLATDAQVQAMSACLNVPDGDWRRAVADPVWAESNHHAQVLLTGTALAAWQQLCAAGLPRPVAVAGYSVGEVPAFCAAGVYDAATALALAHRRAQAMSDCAAAQPGGLLAVTGLDADAIAQGCREWGLALAIDNGPRACIVGGPLPALSQAEAHCLDLGARPQRLRIGVASHTPWMRAAAQAFGEALAAVPCQRPHTVLFSDVTGARVADGQAARTLLAEQIAAPVRWHACMESLYARRVSCVLEIGPGHALARLWQAAHPDVPARSCDDFRSAHAAVAWARSHGAA